MVPAPAAKVGMENEIKDAQGAQHRRGPVMCASMRNCFCILELGEEDNLTKVAQANVLTEDMDNNLDNPPTKTRKQSLLQHCENTSLDPVVRIDLLS
jgi:hypothetical protein